MANLDQILNSLGARFGVLAESSTTQLTVIAGNADVAIGDTEQITTSPFGRGPDSIEGVCELGIVGDPGRT